MNCWDWSKLPKEEHHAVAQALREGDRAALLAIHDRFALSNFDYSCCDGDVYLAMHFKWALENGLIKSENEGTGH